MPHPHFHMIVPCGSLSPAGTRRIACRHGLEPG
ncbi:transposase [Leisingera sp.]